MAPGTRKAGNKEVVTSTALVSNNNAIASTSSAVSIQPNKVTTKSVPAFLNKLYLMVDDSKSDDMIRWSDDGHSFHVLLEQRFGKEMLPRYFKHSNFGSFVRQLNMYGFHKVPHIQQGVLHSEPDDASELLEFANANFLRGQPDLLHLIRRQKARTDGPSTTEETALDLPTLLTDLSAIRQHQSALSADLKELQTSNNTLWQEALQSRERHNKQQDTITKILRFLATVFGGQVAGGDNGQSPSDGVNVVVEEEGIKETDDNNKGKGKETARTSTKRKTQLYLTDVPGRIGTGEDDGEEIEEIPQARHENNLSTISSSAQYTSTLPAMARTNSFSSYLPSNSTNSHSPSRFSTVPSPNLTTNPPTPFNNDFSTIPPDILNSLLAGNNSDALSTFLSAQVPLNNNNLPSTSTGMTLPSLPAFNPTPDYTRTLLPSPGPSVMNNNNINNLSSVMPNNLAAMLPSFSNSIPFGGEENFNQALLENQEVLQEVTLEKADIDKRTRDLEEAINKLINTLPSDTRGRLENETQTGGGFDLNGIASVASGSGGGGNAAMNWENTDDFLSQYVNTENSNLSQLGLNSPSLNTPFSPIDYSFLDPVNYGQVPTPINTTASVNQFESVSPSDSALWKGQHSTSSERSDSELPFDPEEIEEEEDEEDDGDDDGDYVDKKGGKKSKGKGKGKKRKSDVLGDDKAERKKNKS